MHPVFSYKERAVIVNRYIAALRKEIDYGIRHERGSEASGGVAAYHKLLRCWEMTHSLRYGVNGVVIAVVIQRFPDAVRSGVWEISSSAVKITGAVRERYYAPIAERIFLSEGEKPLCSFAVSGARRIVHIVSIAVERGRVCGHVLIPAHASAVKIHDKPVFRAETHIKAVFRPVRCDVARHIHPVPPALLRQSGKRRVLPSQYELSKKSDYQRQLCHYSPHFSYFIKYHYRLSHYSTNGIK